MQATQTGDQSHREARGVATVYKATQTARAQEQAAQPRTYKRANREGRAGELYKRRLRRRRTRERNSEDEELVERGVEHVGADLEVLDVEIEAAVDVVADGEMDVEVHGAEERGAWMVPMQPKMRTA